MKKYIIYLSALLLLITSSCGRKYRNDPLGDSGRTVRTENLLANLTVQADTAGYLFGHADGTLYGVGWEGDSARSDVQEVTGDWPALLALDISGVETARKTSPAGVSLSRVRAAAMAHFDKGGAVLLSWAPQQRPSDEQLEAAADSVAAFLHSLVMPYGVRVPVLLRPLADGEGWTARLSAADYRALWHRFVSRLRDNDVVSALMVYSFQGPMRCPVDEEVDLLELRLPCPEVPFQAKSDVALAISAHYRSQLHASLQSLHVYSRQHHKPMALATGMRGLRQDNWWTRTLGPVIDCFHLAYVCLGPNSNHGSGNFYVPFPGQQTAADFVKFYNDPRSLFLHDVNGLYLRTRP